MFVYFYLEIGYNGIYFEEYIFIIENKGVGLVIIEIFKIGKKG